MDPHALVNLGTLTPLQPEHRSDRVQQLRGPTNPPRRSARARLHQPEGAADRLHAVLSPNETNRRSNYNQKRRIARRGRQPLGSDAPVPDTSSHRHGRASGLSSPDANGQLGTPSSHSLHSPRRTPRLSAKELLRRARETASQDSDGPGRRPFIMDVILDAQLPVAQYREDILMNAIESGLDVFDTLPPEQFTFRNQQSLDEYWTRQEAVLRGLAGTPLDCSPRTLYQVSAERSTAAWDAALDGDEHVEVEPGAVSHSAGPSRMFASFENRLGCVMESSSSNGATI